MLQRFRDVCMLLCAMPFDPHALREQIRSDALTFGFDQVGFAQFDPLPHGDHLLRWIAGGMAGEMRYLERTLAQRTQPHLLMANAKTALCVATSYATDEQNAPVQAMAREPNAVASKAMARGIIARYARGLDYHFVLYNRLQLLATHIEKLVGEDLEYRIAVDTAPLLERELAKSAGLGFIGKNTMLITPGIGSYTVLGFLLLTLELPPDSPSSKHCGQCNECLHACPTGALVEPYLLDSRRCISYLTIEHRGLCTDENLCRSIHPWIFGCDACQEACPHNAHAGRSLVPDPELAPPDRISTLALDEILSLRAGQYRRLIRGRALARASRAMLVRNAAWVVSGIDSTEKRTLRMALEHAASSPSAIISETARQALKFGKKGP